MRANRTGSGRSALSAHGRLLALQGKIHRSLRKQVRALLGEPPAEIRRYEKQYRRDLPKASRPAAVGKDELIAKIRAADVTFIADFHAFPQAQRTALRILRQAARKDEPWWLGLEIFPSHQQDLLDRFQSGELGEDELLSKTGYRERWGFPWEHYAPLLRWAVENGVRLLALDRPPAARSAVPRGSRGLAGRDCWSAGVITDLFATAQARPKLIVLYGELHIGKSHLPLRLKRTSSKCLAQPLQCLRVHQNDERLYWRSARRGKELQTEILRLGNADYCVLSATPWAKLQSLVSWAEGASPARAAASGTAMGEWDADAPPVDYLSLMRSDSSALAGFFGLPVPSFDGVTVRTMETADWRCEGLSAETRRLVRYHVLHNQRFYLPEASLAYLATPSENGAAELASLHLFAQAVPGRAKEPFFKRDADGFHRAIVESAFGFLGSLVLNPRRKCDLLADHRLRLKALARDAAAYPHEKPARELAITYLEQSPVSAPRLLLRFLKNPAGAAPLLFGARYVGHALAKRVHALLVRNQLGPDELREIFFGLPAPERYHALRKAAGRMPAQASKSDHL